MAKSHHHRRHVVRANHHLFRDPNVLSVGIGYKKKDGADTDELALIVSVRKKIRNRKAVPTGYRVPEQVPAGRNTDGSEIRLATDVVVARPKRFSAAPLKLMGNGIAVDGGKSAGTLGGFVRDQNGAWNLLSCSHVMTDFGRVATIGATIRGAGSQAVLGALRRFYALQPGLENEADVAIARVTHPGLLAALQGHAAIIPGFAGVKVRSPVMMHGAVSKQTVGTVSKTAVSERIFGWGGSSSTYCIMTAQIEVTTLGVKGDSGGLVTDDRGYAVGLFVADNGSLDLVTPIKTALAYAASPHATERAPNDDAQLQLAFL